MISKYLEVYMNNKGQTLAIFIIILPILLIVLTLIVDLGLISIEKRKINNNTKYAIEYYLENYDNVDVLNNVKELLQENLGNVEIIVDDTSEYIILTVSKTNKSIYNLISKNNDIEVTYKGFKSDKSIIKG